MAQTLVEATKLSNDVLQRGIIELFVKDDMLLEKLPFIPIVGNGLTYNVETTLSPSQFYDVGDTWVEGTSTVTPTTAVLKILGGDADVDNFLQATRSNVNDLMGDQIAAKIKSMKRAFLDALFYGYATGGATKDFDGLQYLIRRSTSGSANTIAVATSSGTSLLLSTERVEAGIDLVKGGKPSMLIMSKLMRRSINKYLNAVGGITKTEVEGKTVQSLVDIPIMISEHIRDNESADLQYGSDEGGTSVYGHNYADGDGDDDDGGTTIFALSLGAKQLTGIHTAPIVVTKLGDLETKDAQRVRMKWYVAIMLQQVITCSKITGIDANGVVTA
jgi:hypothetical protein